MLLLVKKDNMRHQLQFLVQFSP